MSPQATDRAGNADVTDPHKLRRFLQAQENTYQSVLTRLSVD